MVYLTVEEPLNLKPVFFYLNSLLVEAAENLSLIFNAYAAKRGAK